MKHDPRTSGCRRPVSSSPLCWRAASGPEPIRKPEELFLVDRAQHRSRGPLDNLVFKGRNRDRALPTIRLGYVNPPRRECRIRSPMNTSVQILKIALKVLLVIRHVSPSTPAAAFSLSSENASAR